MKKLFLLLFIFIAGFCLGCAKRDQVAISIDSIDITSQEFQAVYQNACIYAGESLSRKEFLETLISRKLMLKEAEILGLDKDPRFLEGLQLFWEQSLLKFVLARKINELAIICRVSEKEIRDYFERHKDKEYAGKGLQEVSGQIKLLLFNAKQNQELQRWANSLKKNAKIKINYELLNIPN